MKSLLHLGPCPPLPVRFLHVVFNHLQSSSHHRSQGTSGSFRALVPLWPLLPWGSRLTELPLVAFAALQSKGTDISVGQNFFCRKISEMSNKREVVMLSEMFLPSVQACPFLPVFLVSLLVPGRGKKKGCWNGKAKKSHPNQPLPSHFPGTHKPESILTHPWEPTRRPGSCAGQTTIHRCYSWDMAEFGLQLLQHGGKLLA